MAAWLHGCHCVLLSLSPQVAELERTLRERDAQMEALNCTSQQVSISDLSGLAGL